MAPEAACGPSLLYNEESVVSFPPRLLMASESSWPSSKTAAVASTPFPCGQCMCRPIFQLRITGQISLTGIINWRGRGFICLFLLCSLHHWTLGLHMSKWSNVWVTVNVLGPGLHYLHLWVQLLNYLWFSCPLLILSFSSTQWEWWYCPRETDGEGIVCKTFRRACSISQALPWCCLLKLIFYVYEYCLCMCVCVPDMWLVHTESRGGCWIIWNWSFL